jgi:hypothetical protein
MTQILRPTVAFLDAPDGKSGLGDFTWSYDFKEDEGWTIPLGFQVGRITQIGRYKYNLSMELLWVPKQDGSGPSPERGVKLGFVWLLPE